MTKVLWVLLAVVMVLHMVTFEAIRRSQQRADCYRALKDFSKCPKPAKWEQWFSRVFMTEGRK